MKELIIKHIEKRINLDEPKFITLVLENKVMFYKMNKYCFDNFDNTDDFFNYLNNGLSVPVEKAMHFIVCLYDLNLNTKRNINALYKILKSKYYIELKSDISSLKDKVKEIVSNISSDFDIELKINSQINEDDLFKVMDLRFDDSASSLLESLIKYCLIIYELQNINIFIFNNLHQYFETNELKSLFYEFQYNGLTIINLENDSQFQKNHDEELLIIDNDICSII